VFHSDGQPVELTGAQLRLFEDGGSRPKPPPMPPHHPHVDTSRQAAEKAAPTVPGRKETLLDIIRVRGALGATNDELVVATGWPVQSVTPLTNALARNGLITDSGQRRPTKTGSSARVWVLATESNRV